MYVPNHVDPWTAAGRWPKPTTSRLTSVRLSSRSYTGSRYPCSSKTMSGFNLRALASLRRMSVPHRHCLFAHRRTFNARACRESHGVYCSWPDSNGETLFPYLWLRDACQEPTSVHPSSRQKLFKTSDVTSGVDSDSIEVSPNGLRVYWSQNSGLEHPQSSHFDADFLRRFTSTREFNDHEHLTALEPVCWSSQSIGESQSMIKPNTLRAYTCPRSRNRRHGRQRYPDSGQCSVSNAEATHRRDCTLQKCAYKVSPCPSDDEECSI